MSTMNTTTKTSILEVVEKLQAGTVTKRKEAFEDLDRTLKQLKTSNKIYKLRDEAWLEILTTIFSLAKSDKHDIFEGSAASRKRAETRLSNVASALRLVVGYCNTLIRSKTANAVLDHVISLLVFERDNELPFRQIIQADYIKIFEIITSNAAHGEHSQESIWRKNIDWLLEAIDANLATLTNTEGDSEDVASFTRGPSIYGSVRSSMPVRTSDSGDTQGPRPTEAQLLDSLVTSLRNLASLSNCPLQTRMRDIAQTVLRALATSIQTKDIAFECLNSVLMVARTEQVSLLPHIAAQILVIMRKSWSHKIDEKSFSLREQMLVSLLLIRQSLAKSALVPVEVDRSAISALARHMSDEYANRTEQYCLHLDNLLLSSCVKDEFFHRCGVTPDDQSTLAMLNWSTITLVGSLTRLADDLDQAVVDRNGGSPDRPRKRQRTVQPFTELVRLLFTDAKDLKPREVTEFLSSAIPMLEDDKTGRASWAMLTLAKLSKCKIGQEKSLQVQWLSAWTSASRLVTSLYNSRAACFLMAAIIESGILDAHLTAEDIIGACFQSGSRGPPVLTDASLLLFTASLRSKLLRTERHFVTLSDRVFAWLDTVWTLPTSKDYRALAIMVKMASPVLLFHLLSALGGIMIRIASPTWIPYQYAIYRAYTKMNEHAKFANFITDGSTLSVLGETIPSDHIHDTHFISRPRDSVSLAHDFLARKLESLCNAYREAEWTDCNLKSTQLRDAKRRTNINHDMVTILSVACAVFVAVSNAKSIEAHKEWLNKSWKSVLDYVRLNSDQENEYQRVCSSITRNLLTIVPDDAEDKFLFSEKRLQLAESLRELMSDHNLPETNPDDMDLEFFSQPFESQQSQGRSQSSSRSFVRREFPTDSNSDGSMVGTRFKLLQESLSSDLAKMTSLAIALTDFILGLAADDVLILRSEILEWLADNIYLTTKDVTRLLQHVASICLQGYEYERNEVALCFCLRVLRTTQIHWLTTDEVELSDSASDIYTWFIKKVLGKGLASDEVLYNISQLLDTLMQRKPKYGTDLNLPSPRTSLFGILKTAASSLRFRLIGSLETLFDGYVLSEHAAIFDDIVDCLPTDPGDEAGIAVRLYTLAKLGSRWRTVLRQAVYHVFETAANVPTCIFLARKSLNIVAKEVDPDFTPAKLLHLFAPQLFFTWLEQGTIDTIPYAAFGFESLPALVSTERRELIAQTVMRCNTDVQQMLAALLNTTWKDLVEENFATCWVYAIASDIESNRAGSETGPAEHLLKDQLKELTYSKLCKRHFPEAVACLMLSLSDDRGFDKLISHGDHYREYKQVAETIHQKGYSNIVHPSRQQPSFRAKYLLQILAKLCLNAGLDPSTIWTPALLIHVYRRLFNDAESALGPLHVAGIIRRLRMTIVLGGSPTFHGYPLEMLLHNLRPYLTNFQCAEDTIGLFWFLLENGTGHLEHRLSYLTGLSVSIFASLSVFVKQSQESTTQESQFVSTMSKALEFRNWLGGYLESLNTSNLDLNSATRYRNIIQEAKDVSQTGTNSKHENEGRLIYYILLDQSAVNPLVSRNLFELIIQHLSQGFRNVQDAYDDILHESEDTVNSATVLWSIVRSIDTDKSFLTWAGAAIGRAYALRGPKISGQFMDSSRARQKDTLESSLGPVESRQAIMERMTDMLWSAKSTAASMAEDTICHVLSLMSRSDRKSILVDVTDWTKLSDLVFEDGQCPPLSMPETEVLVLEILCNLPHFKNCKNWAASIGRYMITEDASNEFLNGLLPLMHSDSEFGTNVLPFVVHLILHEHADDPKQEARKSLSRIFANVLSQYEEFSGEFVHIILDTVLYLQRCTFPRETTSFRRHSWLDIDTDQAAAAALSCGSPHTALLMLEISQSEKIFQANSSKGSRRSSVRDLSIDADLVSNIFRAVDDDDFFYAVQQRYDISAIVAKLRHEGQGGRLLALQSAAFDSSMKSIGSEAAMKSKGNDIVSALSLANLNSIAFVTQQHAASGLTNGSDDSFGASLLNIHQWDVSLPDGRAMYSAATNNLMSNIQTFQRKTDVLGSLNDCIFKLTSALHPEGKDKRRLILELSSLASLSDVQLLVSSNTDEQLDQAWVQVTAVRPWYHSESFDSVSTILTAREAVAAAMKSNDKATDLFQTSAANLLKHEIKSVRASLSVAQSHDAAQFQLNRAVYLTHLQKVAADVGLDTEKAIVFDVANTLWAQGEITVPIEMLKALQGVKQPKTSEILISDAELLSDLGQKLSQARLDRIDEITTNYLQPAIKALGKSQQGSMAGRVYHNFAVFCDRQLEDSAGKDDFERVFKMRHRKMIEVNELAELYQSVSGAERNEVKSAYAKAKVWFKLDDEEYQRMKSNREQLLQKSLENYLFSLQACNDYSKDVLRLMSLWLGNASSSAANKTVTQYQEFVPSVKLVPFMNQLASRLQDENDPFQQALGDVLYRISCDHPYHSYYQLFAVAKTKGAPNDPVAASRHKRAKALTTKIHGRGDRASAIWISINNSSIFYTAFAQEKLEKDVRTGAKIQFRNFKSALKLEQTLHNMSQKIPPPTMTIALRTDRDYSSVPVFNAFEQQISVAGGMSAPKIVTALATNGSRYKMLLKGGNDDLRQDAIMEQVFAQTSELLQEHRSTRQRNLGIRTYKVVPLTHSAGIIEFVQNTVPLHEYLLPAHTRYFPKDMKSNACRKKIADVQNKKPEERLKAYREVTQQFQPVMRFFFMERFLDPDEWFQKRLNYSRTTAAISILGHVLGLGDRHGHNILLDEQSGEVVHIDLGVAFESGRVLPVPEVVPFRLTRDLVDGMGISGVEGPFRRCCEFTLEALRKSQDSIMTILDVLRFDPVYSWSMSPLRIQRIQQQQEQEAAAQAAREGTATTVVGDEDEEPGAKKSDGKSSKSEASEAERALGVVSKKLAANLSVEATVNELIREATDEKNLAVLYCGWGAYV